MELKYNDILSILLNYLRTSKHKRWILGKIIWKILSKLKGNTDMCIREKNVNLYRKLHFRVKN